MYSMYTKASTISATQARQNFFKLLDQVKADGQPIDIIKDGVVVATLQPPVKADVDWPAYFKELAAAVPFITDEDVEQMKAARKGWKTRFPEW